MTFTDGQLKEIRHQSLEIIAHKANVLGTADRLLGEEATAENVAAYLEEHPECGLAARLPLGGLERKLATADRPAEIYAALVNGPEGDPDGFLQTLMDLGVNVGLARGHDHDEMADDFADAADVSARPSGC